MAIFKSDKIKEELEASQAEVVTLEALVKTREEEASAVTEQLATANNDLASKNEEIEALTAQVATLETEKTELDANLAESIEAQADFDTKVAEAASAKLAEIGHTAPIADTKEDKTEAIKAAEANIESAATGAERYKAVKALHALKV